MTRGMNGRAPAQANDHSRLIAAGKIQGQMKVKKATKCDGWRVGTRRILQILNTIYLISGAVRLHHGRRKPHAGASRRRHPEQFPSGPGVFGRAQMQPVKLDTPTGPQTWQSCGYQDSSQMSSSGIQEQDSIVVCWSDGGLLTEDPPFPSWLMHVPEVWTR